MIPNHSEGVVPAIHLNVGTALVVRVVPLARIVEVIPVVVVTVIATATVFLLHPKHYVLLRSQTLYKYEICLPDQTVRCQSVESCLVKLIS